MSSPDTESRRPRVAFYCMFPLVEQFDLAAEFKRMIETLAETCDVMHLSLGGPQAKPDMGSHVIVDELPLQVDRRSRRDIAYKSLLQFLCLPIAAARFRKFKPDVIYMPDIIPMLGWFLKVMTGARMALSYGDWHIHNKLGKKAWAKPLVWLAAKLDQFEVDHIDCFTCRAMSAVEKLKTKGVKPEQLRMFHDAPDPNAFGPRDQKELRQKIGFKMTDVVLLYHGVMHQGKGIDMLINWTADLCKEHPEIGMILVGAGPELQPLKDLAQQRNMARRIHFTGWLKTTKEVGDYCNAADICIAMRTGAESNIHIIPGALLHSMACGSVVIGPRLPGMAEIIDHGRNGFMFTADNGDAFKELIRQLIRDRDKWPVIAQNALNDVRDRYSIEATAKKYAGALEYFARLP